MDERIRAEATADEAGTLWTAADVLMGLRYSRQLVAQLLQGVHGMKESVTYQAILEEGVVKGEVKGKVEARQRSASSTRPETIRDARSRKRDGPPRYY